MGAKLLGVFRDSAGNAVASPSITVYMAGTSTPAATFSDVDLDTALANPFTGSADGSWECFVAPGRYRITGPGGVDEDYVTATPLPMVTNVKDYGAQGDNSTDDTVSIQNALTAALGANQPLYFPPGTYKVIGSGTEIFKVTKPISILGSGKSSAIAIDATVPGTRSLFLYEPASTFDTRFFQVRDLQITDGGSGAGQYGILVKPAVASTIASRFFLERLWIQNIGSFAVYLDGSVAGTSGIFTGAIRDCQFNGNGVGGTSVLDSILIDNCVMAGTGYGVDLVFGSGPGKMTMRNCNVSASSGLRFRGAMAGMLFEGNYLESQSSYDGANGALLDMDGDTATLTKPVIRDCIFTALTGTGTPDGVRLNKTAGATVAGCFFNLVDAGSSGIVITGNAARTRIDEDNWFQGAGTPVVDGSANNLSDRLGGVLDVETTQTATSGTTEETVFTAVIESGVLDEIGRSLRLVYGGSKANNANSVTVNIKLNGTLLDGWTTTSSGGVAFYGEMLISKDGPSTQKALSRRTINGASDRVVVVNGTEVDTADITLTISIRSATSAGDITFEMAYLELIN